MYSKHVLLFGCLLIYISLWIDCIAETRNNCTYFIWRSLQVHSGSLRRIYYLKQICLAQPLSFEFLHCSYGKSILDFYLNNHIVYVELYV